MTHSIDGGGGAVAQCPERERECRAVARRPKGSLPLA